MNNWVDLRKEFPKIRGYQLHVLELPIEDEDLEAKLLGLDFAVYKINGANVSDETSFFREVAKVFDFPAHFGKNWGAWDDSLGDFMKAAPQRVAIIWLHAMQTCSADAQTFLQAVCDLNNLTMGGNIETSEERKTPKQVEVFIIE